MASWHDPPTRPFSKRPSSAAPSMPISLPPLTPRSSTPRACSIRLLLATVQDACESLSPSISETKRRDGLSATSLSRPRQRYKPPSRKPAACGKTVNRPNVMIKIPATPEGIPRFTRLSKKSEHSTSPALCAVCLRANRRSFLVRARSSLRQGPEHPATSPAVASFFVSRIDTTLRQ